MQYGLDMLNPEDNGVITLFEHLVDIELLTPPTEHITEIKGRQCRVQSYTLLHSRLPFDDSLQLCKFEQNDGQWYYHGTHLRSILQILYDGSFRESTLANVRTECTNQGLYTYKTIEQVLTAGYSVPFWLYNIPGKDGQIDESGDLLPHVKQAVINRTRQSPTSLYQFVLACAKCDRATVDSRKSPHQKGDQYIWPADGISPRELHVIQDFPNEAKTPAGHYRLRLDAVCRDHLVSGVPDAFNCFENLNQSRQVNHKNNGDY